MLCLFDVDGTLTAPRQASGGGGAQGCARSSEAGRAVPGARAPRLWRPGGQRPCRGLCSRLCRAVRGAVAARACGSGEG